MEKISFHFFGALALGITFSLGMYAYESFFKTSAENAFQANIFAELSEDPPVRAPEENGEQVLQRPEQNKLVLRQGVSNTTPSAGDDVELYITLHNRSENDYENLEVIDNFPFEFLEFEEGNDLRGIDSQNGTLLFGKKILRAGDVWTITLRAQVKNGVSGHTPILNILGVNVDDVDTSELYSSAEMTVVPKPAPTKLIQSGGLSNSLVFFILSLFSFLSIFFYKRKSSFS